MLDLRNVPANLISLGAIDFGIIVDSAVIIIEDVLHKLEQDRERIHRLRETIVDAVKQMGRPILFSKAILLTAFIPLYTLQRVEGKIFKPVALTLTFALVVGTILALTVVPVLASFAFKKNFSTQESWIVHQLHRIYQVLLNRALQSRALFLGGAMLLLLLAGVVLTRIGSEFLPKLDEGTLWVRAFMPETISPSQAGRLAQDIRRILVSFPEVQFVVSQLARPDDGTDINGFDILECNVALNPDRSQWKTAKTRDALDKVLNQTLSQIPGVQFQFSQYIEDNVNEAVSGVKSELSIKIYGEDPNKLQALSDQIVDLLKKIPGAADVSADELLGQPQVQITVDRAAIARYGLAVADVQQVIATALGGATATQVLEGERTFDLVVKVAPKAVSDLEAIRQIPVFGSNGERLTLGQLASVDVRQGFSQVWREENARRTAVKFSVRGRDLGSLVGEAKQKVGAQVKLSVSALVGFMALFGIAMLNGVILIERIRELRGRGQPLADAVHNGAMSRVRPVVMTALMAALGLLPMALSTAVGAETSRPFAVVIIGGLLTATLVTLLILPLLYPWFEPEGQSNPEAPSI